MDATGKTVQCVVVTPERAVLDEPADSVVLPMLDGELGVLSGRRPLIGRLGAGELRLRRGDVVKRVFIDGGFAQVHNNVVTLVTPRAVPAEELSAEKAQRALTEAQAQTTRTPVEQDRALKAQAAARAQLRVLHRLQGQEGHG